MEDTRERPHAKEPPPAGDGAAPAPPVVHAKALPVHVAASPTRCPYCHDDIPLDRDNWVVCKGCLARHHASCWGESRQCASCSGKSCLRAVAGTAAKTPRRSMYSILSDRPVLEGEDAGQSVYWLLATTTASIVWPCLEFRFLWGLAVIPFVWIAILLYELKQRTYHEAMLRKALEHRREVERARTEGEPW